MPLALVPLLPGRFSLPLSQSPVALPAEVILSAEVIPSCLVPPLSRLWLWGGVGQADPCGAVQAEPTGRQVAESRSNSPCCEEFNYRCKRRCGGEGGRALL